MTTIFVSFDLSGSARLKSMISDVCKDDADAKIRLLNGYKSVLFNYEESFIKSIERVTLNLNSAFLIKTIGDEYWYTVESADDEDRAVGIVDIIQALVSFASQTADFTFSGIDPDCMRHYQLSPTNVIKTSIKCYADILYDYEDFERFRSERLLPTIRNIFQSRNSSVEITENDLTGWSDLLKANISSINDGRMRIKTRFDPIGKDIDLFFRAAKFALPGVLTIGNGLMESVTPEFSEDSFRIGAPGRGHGMHMNFIKKNLPREDLKGLSHDYTIFYLPHIYSSAYLSEFPREMKETRDMLIQHGFLTIKDPIQYSRTEKWVN